MHYKAIIMDRSPWMYLDMALQAKTILEKDGNEYELVNRIEENDGCRYIFFGTAYPTIQIPKNSIITNFDDFRVFNTIISKEMIETCELWDYSSLNIENATKIFQGASCKLFEMGYTPLLDFHLPPEKKTIDILLIGLENSRRQVILDVLRKKYNVVCCYYKNGKERAELINKSKICISIYTSEMKKCISASRFTPILCSGGFIITETCDDEYQNERWSQFTIPVLYGKLIETVDCYYNRPNERERFANRAYSLFKSTEPTVRKLTSLSPCTQKELEKERRNSR